MKTLPSNRILLGYYGDDFTGSTDVMEALTLAGVSCVLFVEPPSAEDLARYPEAQAVGIAGLSRSLSPAEMDAELPAAYQALRDLRPNLIHYKTCSTFDSSPEVGSIGRALDLGQEAFASPWVPVVVGAPPLGRYCVFGNLFARSGPETEPFRLDRHPTMSRHPVTPMSEADLRLHLGAQTGRRIALIDAVYVEAGMPAVQNRLSQLRAEGAEVVLLDVLSDAHLARIGDLLWSEGQIHRRLFVVGSSGVEYALTAHWRAAGLLTPASPPPHARRVDQIVAVSGSCSPVTDRQIGWAIENGFEQIALDASRLANPSRAEEVCRSAVTVALDRLERGRSVILHSSRGPTDARIHAGSTVEGRPVGRLIGEALGKILREILERSEITRAAVAGGDTSSFVARELGITALEMAAPMAPGSPLCRVYAPGSRLDQMEMVFKGGQVGKIDFFGAVQRGYP